MKSIEFAPEEFFYFCDFFEAIFYCFSLSIDGKTGWRLPTQDEFYDSYFNEPPFDNEKFTSSWFIDDRDDDGIDLSSPYYILPVRDIT